MDLANKETDLLQKKYGASMAWIWSELEAFKSILKRPNHALLDKAALEANKEGAEGSVVVGYRYGCAPDNGVSWNHADNRPEPGVSMAQVLEMPENNGFAALSYQGSKKKYYYEGVIVGYGSDDEICIKDAREISYAEYKARKGQSPEVMEKLLRKHLDVSFLAYNASLYGNPRDQGKAKEFLAIRLERLPERLRKQGERLIAEGKTGELCYTPSVETIESFRESEKERYAELATLFEDLKTVSDPHRPEQAEELLQEVESLLADRALVEQERPKVEAHFLRLLNAEPAGTLAERDARAKHYADRWAHTPAADRDAFKQAKTDEIKAERSMTRAAKKQSRGISLGL